MSRPLRLALLQLRLGPDPEANFAHGLERIEAAAAQGARLVCTPELFRTRYFCQSEEHANFTLAETIPGPSTERLAELARRLGIVIVASLFERRAPGLFHNTAVVLDSDGRLAGRYRKMHIPDDPRYYEKFYFTPGDLGFPAFDTTAGRIAVLVCWDQWFPEAARLAALAGAEVLFYPTAIGWHPSEKAEWGERQFRAWRLMQQSHAVANGLYVAVPNRSGFEPAADGEGIEFWGGSFVADPSGEVIAQAGHDEETVLMVDCDLDAIEQARTHWPFLRDRRADAYADLSRKYRD